MRKLETTIDLLEALREEHGLESDGEIARALKVKQQVVSSWRTGIRTPGDDHALKIAEALDISPLLVIAISAGERAKGRDSQKMWKKMAEQIARGTVTTFALLALNAGVSAPVTPPDFATSVYSVKRRKRLPEATQPV